MYKMSELTKKNIEKSLGINLSELSKMSTDEERAWIEKRIGKPLTFSKKKNRWIIGRGNPLLSRRKIRTMDDLDSKSKKLFGI